MFSNRYILLYSAAMVILVAIALTVVAVQLQPFQENNIRIEKMQNILASVNINSTVKDADSLYQKFITKTLVVNTEGKVLENVDAFQVDLALELKKPANERKLPIYVCTLDSGKNIFCRTNEGKRIMGPIWGYISFKDDFNTVFGATYDHKGETPGLGAEINTTPFESQFQNKTIFDNTGKFVSIKTKKGAADDDMHGVDAISGGTITSNGLSQMLYDCLSLYENYFKNQTKK